MFTYFLCVEWQTINFLITNRGLGYFRVSDFRRSVSYMVLMRPKEVETRLPLGHGIEGRIIFPLSLLAMD